MIRGKRFISGLIIALLVGPYVAYACGIPDMEIIKLLEGEPNFVRIGDTIRYEIQISNKLAYNGSGGSSLVIIDDFPKGLDPVSYKNNGLCHINDDGDISCFLGGHPIKKETRRLFFSFEVTDKVSCTSITNKVWIKKMAEPDFNKDNNHAEHTVDVKCDDPEIELEKKITKGLPSAQAGDPVWYHLIVRNLDDDVSVKNVKIWDDIPNGLEFVSAQGCQKIGEKVRCDMGELKRKGEIWSEKSVTIGLKVKPNVVFPSNICKDGIDNEAYATGDGVDRANSNTVHLPIDCPEPDITVKKEEQQITVNPGKTVTYKVTVENKGKGDSQHVEFFDTIPLPNGQMTFHDDSDDRCSGNSESVYCNIGEMKAGQKETLDLVFTISTDAPCGAKFINTLRAHVIYKPDVHASSDRVEIVCLDPELTATKKANKSKVKPGDTIIYTIRVDNDGKGVAEHVFIEDRIPEGLTFIEALDDDRDQCGSNGITVTCGPYTITGGKDEVIKLKFTFDPA